MNLLDRMRADLEVVRTNAIASTDGNAEALIDRFSGWLALVPRAYGEVPDEAAAEPEAKAEAPVKSVNGSPAPIIPPLV